MGNTNKTYSEKLKDPRWQRKRLLIFQRDNWACTKCGDITSELQIHHEKYIGEPWDCPNEFLKTVCVVCHKKEHPAPPEVTGKYHEVPPMRYGVVEIDAILIKIEENQDKIKNLDSEGSWSDEEFIELLNAQKELQRQKSEAIINHYNKAHNG